MASPRLVLWDWNGTLLDDLALCVDSLNWLLAQFGYPQHYDTAAYRKIFGFPIVEYYRRAGFDLTRHSFDELAQRYMEHYIPESEGCGLCDGARETLAALQKKGLSQVILSASPLPTLTHQVGQRGLEGYFSRLLGLDDIYARSKVDLGLDFMEKEQIDPGQALMVGDTVHDFEVAQALEVRCVLCAIGHQNAPTLRATGAPVVGNLRDILDFL